MVLMAAGATLHQQTVSARQISQLMLKPAETAGECVTAKKNTFKANLPQ